MKKKFWSVLLVIALLGVVCCLGFIAWHILSDIKAEQGYEEVGALVTESRDENASAAESGDESAAESVLTVEEIEAVEFTGEREGEEAPLPEDIFSGLGSRVDFDALHAINPDLYAWILINDTNINYPVAQHPADDSFYLNHDMYGDARFAGCLYTMRANSKDFTDPNTVIYGHNMKSGSMFHTLHYFENAEFFDKHPYIYVYTADRILVYEIFASRFFTDDNLLYAYNFQDQTSFQKFLDDIIYSNRNMRNNLRSDCEVTTNDRILTLSTCVGGSPEERFLVHGKLLWEGNEDELAEAQRKIEEGTLSGAQTADSMVPEAT
jgi:sortase B